MVIPKNVIQKKVNQNVHVKRTKSDLNKSKILKETEYVDLREFDGYIYPYTKNDAVIILPYDKDPVYDELESIFIREEVLPTFNNTKHYCTVAGFMNPNESPFEAFKRELKEETGFDVKDEKRIQTLRPMFVAKGVNHTVYPFFVNVTGLERGEAKGDGSKWEEMATTIEVDVKAIPQYDIADMQLNYMISMLFNLV